MTETPQTLPLGAALPVAAPLLLGALAVTALWWLAGQGAAALPAAALAVALAAAALAGVGFWWARRVEAASAGQAAQVARLRDLFDRLPLGVVHCDADDRVVMFNRSFRELYAPIMPLVTPQTRFADIVRATVERGMVPEARGREAAWIEERLWQHRHGGSGALRQMRDGRWRRIVELRLADGGVLAYSVEVTDLMQREQALEAARREADLARTRLRDAIEALPAAFELYDADDRLLLANSKMRNLYPRIAHLVSPGITFDELVRANFGAGGLPGHKHDFEAWLAQRQAGRRKPGQPRLMRLEAGRWQRVYERRTSEGGLVGVRIDVTGWIEGGEEMRKLEREVEAERARLVAAGIDLDALPASTRGVHLTADLFDCRDASTLMTDPDALRTLCLRAVADAGLAVVGDRFHRFDTPGGVTGTVLLAESHLAVHTWPEDTSVTLDVFVCNRGSDNRERARRLLAALEAAFGAGRSEHHKLRRGGIPA